MSWLREAWHLLTGSRVSLAIPATSKALAASHGPSWSGVRSLGYTGRSAGLTPQKLAAYLRDAEDGDPRAQAELLRDIEGRDTRLLSVLSTRKRALAGLPWRILPPDDSRTSAKHTELAAGVLGDIPAFRTALFHMMDAVGKGYSGLEIDWRQGGGTTWVAGLIHRPAHWFMPMPDNPMQWGIIDEGGTPGALEPAAWMWHEMTAVSGSTAAGGALGRSLAWMFLFRSMSIKDWLIFAEAYGAPLRVGRYRAGTSEADQDVLWRALHSIGVSSAAIVPEGCTIEFPDTNNKSASSAVYKDIVEWAASEYAVAVLGQTLTTSEGQHGTQALGNVHADVRQDLLESDAEQVSETITNQLIRPLIDFQFGPQKRYPRFHLGAEPPEDLLQRAKLYTELGGLGVRFPASHIHDTFGIPEPAEGEATYGQPQQPNTANPATDADPDAAANADHPHGHDCLVALTDPVDSLEGDVFRVVRQALDRGGYQAWEEVLDHLRNHLLAANAPGELSARLVAALRQLDLTHLAEEVASSTLTAELVGRAQVEAGDIALGEWPRVPPRDALAWWRQKVPMTAAQFASLDAEHKARGFSVARFTTLGAAEAVVDLQREVLEQGLTMAEFEDRFNGHMAAHGLGPREPHRVQLVFRNNTNTAYHAGRWASQTRPGAASRRPYLLYQALSGARPTHAAMDGKVYPVGHPIWKVWYPLNGHNCRCRVRAVTLAELASMGLTVSTDLPTIRARQPDGRVEVVPAVPDPGWQRNPGMQPHEFDWAGFPADWLDAVGAPSVEAR